jgi:serine/threonine protein kinase
MEELKAGETVSPAKKKSSLSVEDFTLKHRLGKGAYGDVYLVLKNSDQKIYAMKQIHKKKLEREEKEYQAMVEKELLSNIKHQGVVKLRYTFQDKTNLYFIQEFCEGGEFINFIKVNIGKLTEELKIFYIAEIVNILEYLHTNGVTHRDLKVKPPLLSPRTFCWIRKDTSKSSTSELQKSPIANCSPLSLKTIS